MVEEEHPHIQFEGRLEDCVLLVKHPLADTMHAWWPYAKFVQMCNHPLHGKDGAAPLCNEDGLLIGHTHSLLKFVSNHLEQSLWHEGECLLMGVAHIDSFGGLAPVELFTSFPISEDWS